MRIKTKILIPAIALTLLVSAAILISDIVLFSDFVDKFTIDRINSASKVADRYLDDLKTKAASVSLSLAESQAVIEAMENNNRAELSAHARRLMDKTGVDFCTIVDSKGTVIARTHDSEHYGDSIASRANIRAAMAGKRLTVVDIGSAVKLAVRSSIPVLNDQDVLVGVISVGYRLDTKHYTDTIKEITDYETTVLLGNERISSTIALKDGTSIVGTKVDTRISEAVLSGKPYTGRVNIFGRAAIAKYIPIIGPDNHAIGMIFIGQYADEIEKTILSFVQSGLIIALIMLAVFIVIILVIVGRIVTPIRAMTKAASALASGDTDIDIQVNTKDEMNALADAFNSMIENTRRQIKVVEHIAAGDFTGSLTARSEKDVMNRALDKLNKTLLSQAAAIREEHERVRLMLDATPLACRLWSRDFKLLEGNEAAVKLFGLKDKREYMERYFELSPEYQPDGQTTRDKIKGIISRVFETGEGTFDWLYRLSDGTPLPCEVMMVRIPYGDDYVVAAYSRDLREQKKMMAAIRRRDNLLDTGHRVSYILFNTEEDKDIEAVLAESMGLLGGCVGADQAYITKNEMVNGAPHFTCKSAWISDSGQVKSAIAPGMSFPWNPDPDWDKRFRQGECMNGPVKELPAAIQKFFAPFETKSVLVIPVSVQEQFWGLVGFSDCRQERFFGSDEVDILRSMSLMMAAAVSRNEQSSSIREAHNRIRLLTNSTPLGFNLWNRAYQNIETNDTAVRLFGVKDQRDYLERFFDLSPECQPDGRPSKEAVFGNLDTAFEKGYLQFEWLHQKPDGTQIPSELTLVRLAYGDDYVVAGYVRDLREYKKMLVAIEQRDSLLQTVNQAADILLRTGPDNFSETLYQCMGLMARAINADRMYIDKNHTEGGALYRTLLYEWHETIQPDRNTDTAPLSYDEGTRSIKEALLRGECVNRLVRDMNTADRRRLDPQGILAVLLVPVFIRDEFWGFVGFSNCHCEQPFTENEESIMRSGSLLVVNALLRNNDMLSIRDTSSRLEIALADAEDANSAKSDFLAHMSHEIRTPLNAVVGLSELILDDDGLEAETEDKLEKIHDSGMTILSIVNDILDISKIESGKFELNPIQYDTPSLINDTVTLNIVRIGEKDIAFKIDLDENLPGSLTGDDLRVKQIFNNLLSNAFKYTHSGTVEWRMSFERDAENVWLVSSVRDTGIGIKPEDMQKLFSAYNQVDTKRNRKVEGTGLGLAITKRLVEMMDGTITVESVYGKGSAFNVRLRQALASDTPIGKEVARNLMEMRYTLAKHDKNIKQARVNLSYAHVLVVDDIATNLDVVKGMLKPYSVKVDCAASGPEAIEMIQAGTPRYGAIFMDHMMPGMDGIEATRIIRENIGTDYARNIPVIALTANAIVGNEDMFLSHGFQAFISKPIDMVKLDFVLRQWVRDKALEKELWNTGECACESECPSDEEKRGSDKSGASSAGIRINGLDADRALQRFSGDKTTLIDVLHSYAANTPPLLSGLRKYLEAKTLEDYAIIVHGIKGSSYGIFAQGVAKAAEALEISAKAGDVDAVKAGHAAFEKLAEALIHGIQQALDAVDSAAGKPAAAKPDPALLQELREACAAFDMDRVDKTMARLESFRYETGEKLVAWLRGQIGHMAFEEIANGQWPAV